MTATDRLIEFALRRRLLVIILTVLVAAGGYLALRSLPIEAFPDVTPVLVQVVTEAEGLAPEEVEDLITYPVETAVNALPGVEDLKSISAFGISVVNVYFQDGTDLYFARQLVNQRLLEMQEEIPSSVSRPELVPPTTGLGQIYQYLLVGGDRSLMELRTIQDWVVRPALRTVRGVADVLSWGGDVKQFQVTVEPQLLHQYGVTLSDVASAVERNNENAGGGFVVRNDEERIIRGIGRIAGLSDLSAVVVDSHDGAPIRVGDVATVALGPEVRRGLVSRDGNGEVVVGIVQRLVGENTAEVIEAVKQRVDEINASLPAGVRIVPFYDRANLVARAIGTVRDALLVGGVLIVIVLFLFLGELRSALIVTALLPLSALAAFILMRQFGFSANLMSLGGLAIGIGMLADGGVVMVENIYRHLAEASSDPEVTRHELVRSAAKEVGRPIVFAISIIIVVFLPLFTLQGVEGKMFSPMAFTISFALLASMLLSLTVTPVLCSLLLGKVSRDRESRVTRTIKAAYRPVLDQILRRRRVAVAVATLALIGSLALVPSLGTEFIPYLNEGSLVVRVTMAPSTSLEAAKQITQQVERDLGTFPEVETVVSFVGRAERSGEPEPVSNTEIYVGLSPEGSWATGRDRDGLVEAMRERLERIPGILVNFSQPIQIRQDELISGVKAQLAIRLFGEDLDTLAAKGTQIAQVVGSVPGAVDVVPEQIGGKPQIQIRVDRAALARRGLSVSDVQDLVRGAVGGETVGQVFEGRRRFDILVRFAPDARSDIEGISRALLDTPDHRRVPLSSVAQVYLTEGPPEIRHDQGQRRLVVQAGVEGRDMGGFVAEGRRRVEERVTLPPGYRIEWGGQFELQQRAMARLRLVVPTALLLIFFLLYGAFESLGSALLVILNVPFALIGGILSLWGTGQYLSVPAAVGFIALFGVAVLNGVVLVTYINQLRAEGMSLEVAVRRGTELRLRPVLMTALVASLGLIPLLLATGTGSEVQRPLATVVVGGLITSTVLTLFLLPALYPWFAVRGSRVG